MVQVPTAHEDYVGGLAWFENGRDSSSSSSSCPLYLVSGGWDSSIKGLIVSATR